MTRYCPKCFLSEADFDKCTRSDFGIPCPDPIEDDPEKTATLRCGPCGFTRIVPVATLVKGKGRTEIPTCVHDNCQCKLVLPAEDKVHHDPVTPEQKSSPNPAVREAAKKAPVKKATSPKE